MAESLDPPRSTHMQQSANLMAMAYSLVTFIEAMAITLASFFLYVERDERKNEG